MLNLIDFAVDISLAKDNGFDVDVYRTVIEAYEFLVAENRETPVYGEILEQVFLIYTRKILKDINQTFRENVSYNTNPDYRDSIWDEAEREFIERHAERIEGQIKDCLRLAKLVYIEEQFYSNLDNKRYSVVMNSPQKTLIERGRLV